MPANPARITSGGLTSGTALDAPGSIGEDTGSMLAHAGFSAAEIAAFGETGLI